MSGDERNEGVSPLFAGLMGEILDESAPVAPQVKHLRKRGGLGAVCGSYAGQIEPMPIGITCPACKATIERLAKTREQRRGKRRSA